MCVVAAVARERCMAGMLFFFVLRLLAVALPIAHAWPMVSSLTHITHTWPMVSYITYAWPMVSSVTHITHAWPMVSSITHVWPMVSYTTHVWPMVSSLTHEPNSKSNVISTSTLYR